MRVVIDTNVIVSALLSPGGTPAKVIGLFADEEIDVLVDDHIIDEYESVLSRSRLGISPDAVAKFLFDLHALAENIISEQADITLPDASDTIFLECALTGLADCIVTGNKRHFPAKACRGVRILSPAEFVREFSRRK